MIDPLADVYRPLWSDFAVYLVTANATVSPSKNVHALQQQSRDASGAFVPANPGRGGSTTVDIGVEITNALVPVGTFVFARSVGTSGGSLLYEFVAPFSAGGVITGPVTLDGPLVVTSTAEFAGTSTTTFDSGSGIVLAGPTIGVTSSTTVSVSTGQTLTLTGSGTGAVTVSVPVFNVTSSTTNVSSSVVNLSSSTINATANTSINVTAGKTLTLSGGSGSILDASGIPQFKLPTNTLIGGNTVPAYSASIANVMPFWGSTGVLGDSPLVVNSTSSIRLTTSGSTTGGVLLTQTGAGTLIVSNDAIGSLGLTWGLSDVSSAMTLDNAAHNATFTVDGITIANGSGLVASAISGTVAAGNLPALNGITAPTGDVSLNSHKITNLANGTASTDAATFGQLTALTNGTTWKNPVLLLAHSNITLSGEQTIDGTLTSASRVGVVGQSTASQNGVYTSGSGAWTRTADLASGASAAGVAFYVEEGTTYGGTAWVCTDVTGSDVVGTASLVFVQFATGTSYSAGAGINLTGTTFSIVAGAITNAMLAGSIAASKLVGTDIVTVGTLTAGATGAGFTVALTTSTVTGTLAIAHGGTGVTSVTTAPAATAWAGWDANSNLSANNVIEGYATTVTAAGTTTLTVASAAQQFFTGTTTQTVKLPVVSTLVLGQTFTIFNAGSGTCVLTVQSSGGNTILGSVTSGNFAVLTCVSTSGTGIASWNAQYVNLAQFGAAGTGHGGGLVPDPGSTAKPNYPDVLGGDGFFHKYNGPVANSPSYVPTSESTTSTSPANLTTTQSIAFTLDETRDVLMVGTVGQAFNVTSVGGNLISFKVDTVDENGNTEGVWLTASASFSSSIKAAYTLSLAAGSHTITLRFFVSSGTGTFAYRMLEVSLVP